MEDVTIRPLLRHFAIKHTKCNIKNKKSDALLEKLRDKTLLIAVRVQRQHQGSQAFRNTNQKKNKNYLLALILT